MNNRSHESHFAAIAIYGDAVTIYETFIAIYGEAVTIYIKVRKVSVIQK